MVLLLPNFNCKIALIIGTSHLPLLRNRPTIPGPLNACLSVANEEVRRELFPCGNSMKLFVGLSSASSGPVWMFFFYGTQNDLLVFCLNDKKLFLKNMKNALFRQDHFYTTETHQFSS